MNECKYCNGEKKDILGGNRIYDFHITYGREATIIQETSSSKLAMFFKINYCPMCGKKLE